MSERWLASFLVLSLLALAGMFALWQIERHGRLARSGTEREHAMADEVMYLIETEFDGKTDREKLLAGGLDGIARATGDPHAALWPPQEARRHHEQTEGKFAGIGVAIALRPDGTLAISNVNPDGPADKAGLKRKDVIVAVGGHDLRGMPYEDAVSLVRGDIGTQVKLSIVRAGTTFDVTLTRDTVIDHSVQGTRLLPGTATGYLRIHTFNSETVAQFDEAIRSLRAQGMTALIVDLRHNGGGVLQAAVEIADRFIREDGLVIVSRRASDPGKLERLKQRGALDEASGTVHRSEDGGAPLAGLPAVLLVNRSSASASEVLAGALQDYDLAYLVGERTYGKGSVQRTWPLRSDQRYLLKLTVERYYTPLGSNLDRGNSRPGEEEGQQIPAIGGGIEPDLRYPLTSAQWRAMERRFGIQRFKLPADADELEEEADRKAWAQPDPQIEAALAYLRGEPVVIPLDPKE